MEVRCFKLRCWIHSALVVLVSLLAACAGKAIPQAPPTDTAHPPSIVSIHGLADAASVAGDLDVAMTAGGGDGNLSLYVAMDDAVVAHGAGTTLEFHWDTTRHSNGVHRLYFVAVDSQRQLDSRCLTVDIQNAGTAPGGSGEPVPPGDTPEGESPDSAPQLPAFGATLPVTSASQSAAGDAPPQFIVFSGIRPGSLAYGICRFSLMAVDDYGIASLRLVGGGQLITEASGSTLTVAWDTHAMPDGNCALRLEITDIGGNHGHCDFAVNVDNSVDRDPPYIWRITYPWGEEAGELAFYADDDQGLASLSISIDGVEVAAGTKSPLCFLLDQRMYEVGVYDFRFVATDRSGKQSVRRRNWWLATEGVPRFNVSGTALYANGDPVRYATVTIWAGREAPTPVSSTYYEHFDVDQSNADGRFTLRHVPPGRHPLTIEGYHNSVTRYITVGSDMILDPRITTLP